MSLFEIRLGAGDHSGFSIDNESNTGQPKYWSRDWLSKGHEGVRFIGAGVDKTNLRCAGHDGITIFVDTHPGTVQFENMTIHAGASRAIYFRGRGPDVRPEPKFKLVLLGIYGMVPPPQPDGGRTPWWAHLYQCDAKAKDVKIDATNASEHAWYEHNHAKLGTEWENVEVLGSGGENFKSRGDTIETAYCGKQAKIRLKNCTFKNWYQAWSNRGGGGVILQGAAADLVVDSCVFWAPGATGSLPASARSHCVMVTSEGSSYDVVTGRPNVGVGNGYVIIKNSAMRAGPGQPNYTPMLRVGQAGGSQLAAKGALVEGCGVYGQKMNLQFDHLPAGKVAVRGCNTEEIRRRCEALGMDTSVEASLTLADRVIPVSEGFPA